MVQVVVLAPMMKRGKKRGVGSKSMVPDLGTRRVIVCAPRCPEPQPERKNKGKGKVDTEKGMEKVVERFVAFKKPYVGVTIVQEKEHGIFAEDDSNNFTLFKVLEESDEGMKSVPDIPLSPCVSYE